MEKEKVYDLPTRVFHGVFAVLFLGAFGIAKLVDDESPLFSQHMILGTILFFVAVFRVFWGVVGTRYARFSSFPLSPVLLLTYFRDLLTTKGRRYFGHNPASAWATLVMIGLALGLGITGYLMSTGSKEAFEDAHELLANAFVLVVIAHVAGVVLHALRHRDQIVLSMVHGRKATVEGAAPISRNRGLVAAGLAGIVAWLAFQLYGNYDPALSTTRLFGVTLRLGEAERGEAAESE